MTAGDFNRQRCSFDEDRRSETVALQLSDLIHYHIKQIKTEDQYIGKPWYLHKKLSRPFISTINKLMHQTAITPSYMFLIGKRESPICECRQQPGNINHMIFQCPLFTKQIDELIREIAQLTGFGPWKIPEILTNNEIQLGKILYIHMKVCKMKI